MTMFTPKETLIYGIDSTRYLAFLDLCRTPSGKGYLYRHTKLGAHAIYYSGLHVLQGFVRVSLSDLAFYALCFKNDFANDPAGACRTKEHLEKMRARKIDKENTNKLIWRLVFCVFDCAKNYFAGYGFCTTTDICNRAIAELKGVKILENAPQIVLEKVELAKPELAELPAITLNQSAENSNLLHMPQNTSDQLPKSSTALHHSPIKKPLDLPATTNRPSAPQKSPNKSGSPIKIINAGAPARRNSVSDLKKRFQPNLNELSLEALKPAQDPVLTEVLLNSPVKPQKERWKELTAIHVPDPIQTDGQPTVKNPKKVALTAYAADPSGCDKKYKFFLFNQVQFLKNPEWFFYSETNPDYINFMNAKEERQDYSSAIWLMCEVSKLEHADLTNSACQQVVLDLIDYGKRELRDSVINWLKRQVVPRTLIVKCFELMEQKIEEADSALLYLYASHEMLSFYTQCEEASAADMPVIEKFLTAIINVQAGDEKINLFVHWLIEKKLCSTGSMQVWVASIRQRNLTSYPIFVALQDELAQRKAV